MANKKAKGKRAKTRHLFKSRGRSTVNQLFADFKVGNRVAVIINSSNHIGMPHKRFHGKSGVISEKRGKSFVVDLKQGNAKKSVIVNPLHLHALGVVK